MCLQLPLKILTCIPLKDYSSESLYLGFLEYQAKVGGKLQLVASDAGSQFGPFQNQALGYEEGKIDGEMSAKNFDWMQMVLGRRGKQMEDSHMFLKKISGAHKHLNQIEACVSSLKTVLSSYNHRITSRLSVYEWNYILRLTEKAILSRPLAASSTGKLWTPNCILNLMGRQCADGDQEFDFRPQAKTETVVEELCNFEQKMLKIKREVAYILADSLIEPSFFEQMTREEKIKRRNWAENLKIGDIFFCSHLFSLSFDTTRSLLRLVYLNDAKTGGAFVKVGKHTRERIVTRDFSYLYFVCPGNNNIIFSEKWRPSFNIKQIFENACLGENISFEDDPSQEEISEAQLKCRENDNFEAWMGFPVAGEGQEILAGEEEDGGRDVGEHEEEGDQEIQVEQDTGDTDELAIYTRFGRKSKRTKFFGI